MGADAGSPRVGKWGLAPFAFDILLTKQAHSRAALSRKEVSNHC